MSSVGYTASYRRTTRATYIAPDQSLNFNLRGVINAIKIQPLIYMSVCQEFITPIFESSPKMVPTSEEENQNKSPLFNLIFIYYEIRGRNQ